MIYLIFVSFVWALSFGLIKVQLGGLDPTALAALRIGLALLVFLPFWRPRQVSLAQGACLASIGAVQFGIMYAFYMAAFTVLKAHEV
ncbi:MAG: EamA family transporter, partial [Puniceicoccales bacterium]|nr:EamA family transporter [Puniceicoccales bacterium]